MGLTSLLARSRLGNGKAHATPLQKRRRGPNYPDPARVIRLVGQLGRDQPAFGWVLAVIALDQRNHGDSPHDPVMNYEVMAADVAEFVNAQGVGPVMLVGHSMGGKAAMEFGLRYPGLVEKLVVVDIAPKGYPPWHEGILEALCGLDLSAFTTRRRIEEALAHSIPELAVRQFLLKNLRQEADGAYHWRFGLAGIRANYPTLAGNLSAVGQFRGPTLFIAGSLSDYINPSDLAWIRQAFPGAEMAIIDGAGHWVHAEAPDRFTQVLVHFLQQ